MTTKRVQLLVVSSCLLAAIVLIAVQQSPSSSAIVDEQATQPEDVFLADINQFSNPSDAAALRLGRNDDVAILAAAAAATKAAPKTAKLAKQPKAKTAKLAATATTSKTVSSAPAAAGSKTSSPALSEAVVMNKVNEDMAKTSLEIDSAGALIAPQVIAAPGSFQSSIITEPDYTAQGIVSGGANAGNNNNNNNNFNNNFNTLNNIAPVAVPPAVNSAANNAVFTSGAPPAAVPSADLKTLQENNQQSFQASEVAAVSGDNEQPDQILGNNQNPALQKYVQEIEQQTDSNAAPLQQWQQKMCQNEEVIVNGAAQKLASQKAQLQKEIDEFNSATALKQSMISALVQSTDKHKTAMKEADDASQTAQMFRAKYLDTIAKTNAAKIALVRQRAGDLSIPSNQVERDVAIAEDQEANARKSYSQAVHNRLFAEEAERKAASEVSYEKTQLDSAEQRIQQSDAEKLDAIAEVDAADSSLQLARSNLFACYTRMREAANTEAGLKAEALAKAAMSGVSDAAHVHGGGQ